MKDDQLLKRLKLSASGYVPLHVSHYQKDCDDAAKEIERLRTGIQNYLDGDYEPKIKKIDKCHHGVYGYEACENCIDEHFSRLLTRTT